MTADAATLALRRVAKQIETAIEHTEHEVFTADADRGPSGSTATVDQRRAVLQAKVDGLRLANSFVYEALANEKESTFRRAWEAAQEASETAGSL